jgi:hypothetical protein
MRRVFGIVVVAVGCAVNPDPEPDAATDVVRAAVAPGEAIDLTRQTVIQTQEYLAPASRSGVRCWPPRRTSPCSCNPPTRLPAS